MAPAVAIVTDDPGWHGKVLRRAFGARGWGSRCVSLTECRIELEVDAVRVVMPGFEAAPPAGVFVRGVPGGTLEEVVFYLNVLHSLEALGVVVYNSGRAVERSVDKAHTSVVLHRAGLPTPPTWVARSRAQALEIAARELRAGHQVVSKPLFGSQGQGLQRIEQPQQLDALTGGNGVYYLQRFVPSGPQGSHDWRVFVIGGKAVAAMRRWGQTWLNNVAQGGRCEAAVLDLPLGRMAEQAVAALDMAYGGVDLMCEADGRYTILEVNSVPAWRGLQSVTSADLAAILADDFIARCACAPSLRNVSGQLPS